mmetsp:Transcript_19289/g.21535  ORF Transcript_19289/g.21535 Transcript_19289/m.21535 type:complete len:346 (-) Transcript_19289:105-1142(-)
MIDSSTGSSNVIKTVTLLTLIVLYFHQCLAFSTTNTRPAQRQRQQHYPNYHQKYLHHGTLQQRKKLLIFPPLSMTDNNNDSDTENDDNDNNTSELYKEAQELMARAKAIRDSLPPEEREKMEREKIEKEKEIASKVEEEKIEDERTVVLGPSVGYRLSIDLGRESGTWMDPQWGRSGARIDFTVDVAFLLPENNNNDSIDPSLANKDVMSNMVKDNLTGKSSVVRVVSCPLQRACMREGLGYQMECNGGGYRVDFDDNKNSNQSSTARFYLDVEGTSTSSVGLVYGDIFVPEGQLYFSLPCFSRSVERLSTREGIVTVRQYGWHTGWRRLESRIVGTFRAKPLKN